MPSINQWQWSLTMYSWILKEIYENKVFVLCLNMWLIFGKLCLRNSYKDIQKKRNIENKILMNILVHEKYSFAFNIIPPPLFIIAII